MVSRSKDFRIRFGAADAGLKEIKKKQTQSKIDSHSLLIVVGLVVWR